MNRRTARGILPILVALLVATVLAGPAGTTTGTASVLASTPDDSTIPPVTANDFLPEERDVTDCIGVLERPGCGSESRGGWRQLLVFGLLAGALVVVFTKITLGVRRGRSDERPGTPPDG